MSGKRASRSLSLARLGIAAGPVMPEVGGGGGGCFYNSGKGRSRVVIGTGTEVRAGGASGD